MSKLRADITYSHRLNSKITSDFTILNTNSILDPNRNNNIVDTNTTEILMEKSNEILIEEDSDDEIDPINIENEFGEYLQGWTDMLKEEELANNDDDSDDILNSTIDNIIHPAVDTNAKWVLSTLFKNDLDLLF
jgi:hypothetical protein